MNLGLGVGLCLPKAARFTPKSLTNLSAYYTANTGVYENGACQFTASHKDYLSIASNSTLQAGGQDHWWAFWVYPEATGAVITKYGANDAAGEYYLAVAGATKAEYNVYTGSGRYFVQSNTFGSLSLSTWQFVMAYYDSVNNLVKISVNGGAFDSAAVTGTIQTLTNPFNVGSANDGGLGAFWGGRLDSVGFGKSPVGGIASLATTIRDALYNSGVGMIYSDLSSAQKTAWGLVSWWDLGEETGTRYDSHGTNHLAENFATLIGYSPAVNNGGFETAGAGGADVFASWNEIPNGTSTVNSEAVTVHGGSRACRLDVDGSNSTVSVAGNAQLVVGRRYTTSAWMRSASGTPTARIVYGTNVASFALSTTYTQYSVTAQATSNSSFFLGNNSAASNSIYIDDVTLSPVDIPGTAGIAAGNAIDVNFAAQLNGTTQYMQDPGTGGDYDCNAQNLILSAWVCLDHKLNATPHFISKYQNAGNRNYRLWYDVSADRFKFGVYNTGGAASQELSANTFGAVSVGTWYHVVAYYDTTGSMGIGVNGGAFDTAAVAFSPSSGGGNFVVGQDGLLLNGWPGRIDTVAFARPSSGCAAQAATLKTALYNGGLGAKYAAVTVVAGWGLMHWWDNEERSGSHVNRVTSGQDLVNTGTITNAGGVNYLRGLVSKWNDQGTGGYNLTQTTATQRPGYSTIVYNSKPGLLADGVDDVLSNTSFASLTGDFTLGLVCQANAAPSGNLVVFELAQSATAGLQVVMTSAGKVGIASGGGATSSVVSASSVADGRPHSVIVTRSGTTYTVYVDGVSAGTSGGTAPTYNRAFAFRSAAATLPWAYYLQEVEVYSSAKAAGDVAALYAFHKLTWGTP